MTTHTNAVGYLLALRDEISKDWFSRVCDLAFGATDSSLTDAELKELYKLFLGETRHDSMAAVPPRPCTVVPPAPPADFLEEIKQFHNFKRLSPGLSLQFAKRVTVVFGPNASGKSSLCEAMKILACPDSPVTPTRNVRTSTTSPPSFVFKCRHDTAATQWTESLGYGVRYGRIKYFDSTVAIRHLTQPLEPEAVVEVSPFRLEVFTYARTFVERLRDAIAEDVRSLETTASGETERILEAFSNVLPSEENAISDLRRRSHLALRKALATFVPVSDDEEVAFRANQVALARLIQATSEQGLKLLQAELRTLTELRNALQRFRDLAAQVSLYSAKVTVEELAAKKRALDVLATAILPDGTHLDGFKRFLEGAQLVFDFAPSPGEPCPFCRTPLSEDSVALIGKYRDFLSDEIQRQVAEHEVEVARYLECLRQVRGFTIREVEPANELIPAEISRAIVDLITRVQRAAPVTSEAFGTCDIASYEHHTQLTPLISQLDTEIESRQAAITAATSDREVKERELIRLDSAIRNHRYRTLFASKTANLEDLCRTLERSQHVRRLTEEAAFPVLLRKMTNAGKEAHTQLVMQEFENVLNEEYKALSGRGFRDFGMRLVSRGEQQVISVDPEIGESEIQRVLSEGEQKIHALALFLAEVTERPCDIIVLDDPVTSFDYNYVERFAERLRDYISKNRTSQVIVFTHNWDFFVLIQTILNKSGLNNDLSVIVLENCAAAEEYKEDIDDLKAKCTELLRTAGDLSRDQKERLSGLMRRLIETIVNKHVFNGERHQFKQKTTSLSVFHKFTKVVPLMPNEADRLRDLYSGLSVTEHYDPRNAYICRSKEIFQEWYAEIASIEAAVLARRPP